MSKKKFAETKVGSFLASKAPNVLNAIGDILPDQGTLGIVKNLITSDPKIEPQDKETAMKLIEQDGRPNNCKMPSASLVNSSRILYDSEGFEICTSSTFSN